MFKGEGIMSKCEVTCNICLGHCREFQLNKLCNFKKFMSGNEFDCVFIDKIIDIRGLESSPKDGGDEKILISNWLKKNKRKHYILLQLLK